MLLLCCAPRSFTATQSFTFKHYLKELTNKAIKQNAQFRECTTLALPILSSTSERDKITSKLANATTQSASMLCRNSRWVKSFAKEFQLRDEDFGDRKKKTARNPVHDRNPLHGTLHVPPAVREPQDTKARDESLRHTHKKEVVHKTFSTLFWIVCECGCARWHRTWQPKSTQQQQHGADGTGWAGCFWRIYKHDLLRRTKLFFTRFFTAFPVQCLRKASLHHPASPALQHCTVSPQGRSCTCWSC